MALVTRRRDVSIQKQSSQSHTRSIEKKALVQKAILVDIEVGKLDCYLDGYRYRVCGDAPELAEEVIQRESLLEPLQLGRPGEDRFRQRVEHWKELALRFLPEIYTLRGAIASINRRYFDGQDVLFPAESEGLDQLLALMEKLVGNYNEDLTGSIERVENLFGETRDGHQPSRLTIGMAVLIDSVQAATKDQVSYLVDMAKADALDLLGENRQALELVDRHV